MSTGELTVVHVFDGVRSGFKPKGFSRVGGDFYFVTEGGGESGLGVFGVLRDGAALEVIAELSAEISTKPDHVLSANGSRLYFATELGGANFLGGIVAYDVPGRLPPPTLSISRAGDGTLRLRVGVEGGPIPPAIEAAAEPGGPWLRLGYVPRADGDGWTLDLEPDLAVQFVRAVATP